jgi:hypothetical protein
VELPLVTVRGIVRGELVRRAGRPARHLIGTFRPPPPHGIHDCFDDNGPMSPSDRRRRLDRLLDAFDALHDRQATIDDTRTALVTTAEAMADDGPLAEQMLAMARRLELIPRTDAEELVMDAALTAIQPLREQIPDRATPVPLPPRRSERRRLYKRLS